MKGDKEENGYSYPSLPEIAREFNYSISIFINKDLHLLSNTYP